VVAHGAVTIDDENGWSCDAALFACVVNIPLLHDTAFRVTQDWKWQPQLLAHCFGFFEPVDRDGSDARARRANFAVLLAVIRQLAEAEGSPVPAKEDKHHWTLRDQVRQSVRGSNRIRQLELRRDFSRLWDFGGWHGECSVQSSKTDRNLMYRRREGTQLFYLFRR
jgi:hypothetical protein